MTEKRLKITLDTNTFLLEHVDLLTIGQADVKTTTDRGGAAGGRRAAWASCSRVAQ
jgi:hypothetical protein